MDINLYEQFCLLVQVNECIAPVSGLPQYNVGSFDPFFVQEVSQKRGGNNMNYQLKLKNVYERGWGKSLVTKFRYGAPARLSGVKLTELHQNPNPVTIESFVYLWFGKPGTFEHTNMTALHQNWFGVNYITVNGYSEIP